MNKIERIVSGTVGAVESWVRQNALMALLLALLLIKSFPVIAIVLLVAIGIVIFRTAHQPVHLAIEVNPV